MAEKVLQTKIALLYKTYAQWDAIKATYKPLKGEVCFCEVPASTGISQTEPCILFKVGDGTNFFEALPWASALAADVYAWAKKANLDFSDLSADFLAALDARIASKSENCEYQMSGSNGVWKLQKRTVGTEEWTDVSTVDVASYVTPLLANKVDKEVTGTNGKATVSNEATGAGIKFENTSSGIKSFVGVVDSATASTGLAAQIYADKYVDDQWQGAKLDVTNNGMYYTVGSDSFAERAVAANELAVKGDISEYSMVKDADPGEYASIYHLTKDGVNIGAAIEIAKDQLLKSVTVKTCTEKDKPISGLNVGDKYIDFEFETTSGTSHSYLAVKDMVTPYTAGDGIEISSSNVISVSSIGIAKVSGLQDALDAKASTTALAGKVDKPTEPVSGQGVNVPYYFSVAYDESKATVTDYTVDLLDSSKAPQQFSLDITAAAADKAGLMSAADKNKVDKALLSDDVLILNCNLE